MSFDGVGRNHSNRSGGATSRENMFSDLGRFGRNILFGRLDDLRAFKFENDFRDKLSATTLISRQYKYACPLFACVYVALQLLIGLKSGFCDAYAEPFQSRTVYFYYSAGFSFFMYAVQTTGKIYETAVQGIDQAAVGIYCCALTESLIASSSALITAYWGYGGVCTDALGAQSPCAQVRVCPLFGVASHRPKKNDTTPLPMHLTSLCFLPSPFPVPWCRSGRNGWFRCRCCCTCPSRSKTSLR